MGYEELFLFAGGLGMFIYGMQIMSQGLENAAGNKMKSLLEVLTKNKIMGVALGALITAVIQSSSATTVMVVGFVNAGIMNLTQAMGVIMGANIGTTITGWIVSMGEWASFLKPSTLAPIAIAIGVVVMMVGKRRATKDVASIVVGFGLLFVGIDNMSGAMSGLKEVPAFTNLFVELGSNPILGILVGAGVTAIIQSSSASVGILQSLAVAGLIPFNSAVYIIMGQNFGTCVTAMLSSMGAKKNAKTAALMHLFFNIIGTVIFSIAAIAFFQVVNPAWGRGMITATQISTVHTAFNIATTVLLFPFSNFIIKLAKMIGGMKNEEENHTLLSLDDRLLNTPTIALQATIAEMGNMGAKVKDTLEVSKRALFTRNKSDIELVKEDEKLVDQYCSGIMDYALKLTGLQISDKEHQHVARLIQVLSDMERIGDYCENISEFAETMAEKKLAFSDIGTEGLKEMFEVCSDSYIYAIEGFMEQNKQKALLAIKMERKADELEIQLRAKHIKRLTKQECNTEAGIVFLDTLVCLERISDHARNIAEEVFENMAS